MAHQFFMSSSKPTHLLAGFIVLPLFALLLLVAAILVALITPISPLLLWFQNKKKEEEKTVKSEPQIILG